MSLDMFFRPRSIAVVGASPRADNMGHVILDNLRARFKGSLYVVNPRYSAVEGVPSYPSLSKVPEQIDLAVIAVRSSLVPEVMEDAGIRGVKGVVIFSGGFAETGTEEGRKLQEEVAAIGRRYGIRVLGPNCIGVYNYASGVDTFFLPRERMRRPPPGPIALVSQSGALMATLMDWAASKGIGIGAAINFGNKVDVDEVESVEYLSSMDEIKVIIMYLEGVTKGRELVKAISRSVHVRGKPVIVLKGGKTALSVRATLSHTASIAGNYSVFSEAMKEAGAIVLEGLEDMFDAANALAFNPLPSGNRVAIVTNSGGHGVIAFDELARGGAELPAPSEGLLNKLRGLFPERVSLRNPFDLTGDATPEQYRQVLDALVSSGEYDALLVVALVQPPTMDLEALTKVFSELRERRHDIPIVAVTIGAEFGEEFKGRLRALGVPVYEFPDRAARALLLLLRCSSACRGSFAQEPVPRPDEASMGKVDEILRRAVKEGRAVLLPDESLEVLRVYGIPVADFCVARSPSEASECARRVGTPVALKVISPNITHKSDVGGVILGVETPEQAASAFNTIVSRVKSKVPEAEVRGVLVQRMVSEGVEVLVGGFRDPSFGPVVVFGAGGLLTELLSDISMRLAPIPVEEAQAMMSETRVFGLLKGFRGMEGADLNALAYIISRTSVLLEAHSLIKELDINPILAQAKSAIAVDSRIVLEVDEGLGERRGQGA